MRRCKILTWILIFSVVNSALGAPAPARQALEMSDVAEGRTATSRKRNDPWDDDRSTSTNAGDSPPPSTSPPTKKSPRSTGSVELNRRDYGQSNPLNSVLGLTGAPLRHFRPLGGLIPLPPLRPPRPPLHTGPSDVESARPVNPDTLSSTSHQPALPQRPTSGTPLPDPGPSEDHLPSLPGSSEGHLPSPPGSSVNPLSTGHQPTPPQSPTTSSPQPPLSDAGPPETRFLSPDEFLDDVLKGKIKRGISYFGAT